MIGKHLVRFPEILDWTNNLLMLWLRGVYAEKTAEWTKNG